MNRLIYNNAVKNLFLIALIIIFLNLNPASARFQKNAKSERELKFSSETENFLKDIFKEFKNEIFIDYHLHLLGLDSKNGCYVNPDMKSAAHPVQYLKYKFYLKAGGIKNEKKSDDEYMEKLVVIARHTQKYVKTKYLLFAFDKFYYPDGKCDLKKTQFYVPNEYMFSIVKKYPDLFTPVVSINPYRKDALDELKKWAETGVKYIKWLPNAMGINPADARIGEFYLKMKEYEMILISHSGEEDAINCKGYQKLGNPLLLRGPLDAGVKVIAAHCASSGKNVDFESPDNKMELNFNLLMRMLKEKKYENLLFADISALTQFNRMDKYLDTILNDDDIQKKLVNGSDYPLPAINFIIQTKKLRRNKFITENERIILNEIYKQNPLLFDLVLKMILKSHNTGNKFNKNIFIKKF